MARRLKTIARDINETMPSYRAEVHRSRLNTDRKAGRRRIPRKGIMGNRITVYRNGIRVFTHHTGSLRTNNYVEAWVKEQKDLIARQGTGESDGCA